MAMSIAVSRPPNYDEIVRILGRPPAGAVFTYGEVVHVPSGNELSGPLRVHEATHARQQALYGGPEGWWRRYLDDAGFRREQEVEAYRAQYAYACQFLGRRERRSLLRELSQVLASPMYGRVMRKAEAMEAIK